MRVQQPLTLSALLAVLCMVSLVTAEFYYIQSQLNPELVITADNTASGSYYYMQAKNSTNDLQKFEFLSNGNIRCKANNLVIDIEGSAISGSPLVQKDPSASDTQKWFMKDKNIISKKSIIPQLVMDIKDKNPNPGAQVQVWNEKNIDDKNQEWSLVAA